MTGRFDGHWGDISVAGACQNGQGIAGRTHRHTDSAGVLSHKQQTPFFVSTQDAMDCTTNNAICVEGQMCYVRERDFHFQEMLVHPQICQTMGNLLFAS